MLIQIPWVAQFHSTEAERREESSNFQIKASERRACQNANVLVCVGAESKRKLLNEYAVKPSRIAIVPNSFSVDPSEHHLGGSFESKRVVFLGRLAHEKGPNNFVKVAHALRKLMPESHFAMFGTGDRAPEISCLINSLVPPERLVLVPNSTNR